VNKKVNYLTVAEVCDILRLTDLTIYKYIKAGALAAVEFGGHYRISQDSLNEFIEKHKVNTVEAQDE
jgi:excisionase family DNA binding protein